MPIPGDYIEMKTVFNLKLIIFLHQCHLLHIINSHEYEYYLKNDSGSASQENNNNMNGDKTHHHHHHWHRIQNNDNNDDCSNCACNKCDNPLPCCKKVCDSCPLKPEYQQERRKSMPRIEIISMPGMPPMMPLPMPQMGPMPPMHMPMPQMPMPMPLMSMPPISMPSMSMPPISMPPMSMPPMSHMPPMHGIPDMSSMALPQMPRQFPSPFQSPSMIYMPLPSPNLITLFKNIAPAAPWYRVQPAALQITTTMTPTTIIVTTSPTKPSTQATTTQATTTIAATTTVLTTQQQHPQQQLLQLLRYSNDDQIDDYRMEGNQYLKSQRDDNAFESVLKSAIDDFSNIIVKTPEKTKDGNSKYMLTSLRRTKPTWMPKFGIVPIPDNMAQKLMSQLRTVQGRRRRQKRMTKYVSEEHYSDY